MKAITSSLLIGVTALTVGLAAWAGSDKLMAKSDAPQLTEQEVRTRAEAQGYKVKRIEREHEGFEVKAIDAHGNTVELEFSAANDGLNEDDD